jgi:hypothetical protein
MRYMNVGAAGFFALSLATALAAGCSNSDSMTGKTKGNVRFTMGGPIAQAATVGGASSVTLADGTGRTITSATINLSSILARNLDGQLIDVTMDLPVTVDLIGLINGHTVTLPIGSLPVGSYDQLVIVIRSLHVELSDGTQIDVTPPGGGWTAVVAVDAFDVVDGQLTTVNLHFRSGDAFRWLDGRLEFDPAFDCDADHHHGGGGDGGD